MSKTYYKEEQRFSQLWLWILILAMCGIWIWEVVQQVFMGIPFGNHPASNLGVILTGLFPLLTIVLFRILALETIIDDDGIRYRFRPFQRKPKIIKSEDILRFEVKKYSPLKDYGGWGIRYGSSKNGNAYNVCGNQGVFFELKNGKRFLLGTQRPSEIRSVMEKLMKKSIGD